MADSQPVMGAQKSNSQCPSFHPYPVRPVQHVEYVITSYSIHYTKLYDVVLEQLPEDGDLGGGRLPMGAPPCGLQAGQVRRQVDFFIGDAQLFADVVSIGFHAAVGEVEHFSDLLGA